MPRPISSDAVDAAAGAVPQSFSHRLHGQEPVKAAGGQVRIVDSSNFPAASTIAAALVEVEPGGLRELHWHPNSDEWQYYILGQGLMTVTSRTQETSHCAFSRCSAATGSPTCR
jgi:oxalate decarboxylase